MNKKISKIIILGLFILSFFGIFSFASIKTVNADGLDFNPNVSIPGADDFQHGTNKQLSRSTQPIADYMKALYNWGIGIVGVLAGVVLIIAGMMWLTAGGNNTQVEAAKKWIGGALSGLVLALGSYFILFQINPELVKFRYYTLPGVDVGGEGTSNTTCVGKLISKTSGGNEALFKLECEKNCLEKEGIRDFYQMEQADTYCCVCNDNGGWDIK